MKGYSTHTTPIRENPHLAQTNKKNAADAGAPDVVVKYTKYSRIGMNMIYTMISTANITIPKIHARSIFPDIFSPLAFRFLTFVVRPK